MKIVLLAALTAGCLLAEIKDVQVIGTTPTQAILAFTPETDSQCTVEVSESDSFSPLVNDVNPALFPGADRDNRPGNLVRGGSRVFVVGKRAAARAANGRMYSRALQAFTRHYVRIKCGDDVYTSDFPTQNLALGNTVPEAYPVDPENPGEYAWPNMDFNSGPNEKHVDPQTGILINRLTGPKSYLRGDYPNIPVLGAFSEAGSQNPWRLAGGGLPASYAGDGTQPAKLYLPIDMSQLTRAYPQTYGGEIVQLDWLTATLQGYSDAGGEDAKIQACLTLDGASCIPQALVQEVDLSACGPACTLGNTGSMLAGWQSGKLPAFSGPDIAPRKTIAAYDRATGVLTWSSGHYFNPKWSVGAPVWINGTRYTIQAVNGPKSITIQPGLDLDSPSVQGPSLGLLVWKKTPGGSAAVTVSQAKFTFGGEYAFRFWYQSSMDHCHPAKVQYNGQDGYHCVLTGASGSVLAWINRATGDANLLGALYVNRTPPPDGWAAGAVEGSGGALFDGADPNVMYAIVKDHSGKQIVLRMTYSGDNSPMNGNSVSFTSAPWSDVRNITPGAYDLESLIRRFDPRYDPGRFTCSPYFIQDGALVITCSAGQDVAPGGWYVVINPRIEPSESANPVIAAVSTYGPNPRYSTPLRWCVLHSTGSGDPGWLLLGANPAGSGATFSTKLAQPMGSASDTTIRVTGEPGDGVIDVARVGDVFRIGSENVRIAAKTSATEWIVERGFAKTTPGTYPAGANVLARCTLSTQGPTDKDVPTDAWWNYAKDPRGENASGRTVDPDTPYMYNGHGVFKLGTFTRLWEQDCLKNAGGPLCFVNREGPLDSSIHAAPTSWVNVCPGFAGAAATCVTRSSHASRAQMAAPPEEQRWVVDAFPFLDMRPVSAPVTKLPDTRQLYVMKRRLDTKHLATYASCGSHPLLDVSGPGSLLGDGPADAYKYCVPNAPGECQPGSGPGEVYVNCPNLTYLGCSGSQYDGNGQNTEDVCIFDGLNIFGAQVVQVGTAASSRNGAYTRRITHGFARYRRQPEYGFSPVANGKALPGGEWALFWGRWIDDQRSDIYAAKLPPFPAPDGIDRSTFVPVMVDVEPEEKADRAVVEFGYTPDFRCTSRREKCVAVSSAIDEAAPFLWEGESSSSPASSGVLPRIAVPAISQRVLYYRVVYRAADGSVVKTGETQVVAVP